MKSDLIVGHIFEKNIIFNTNDLRNIARFTFLISSWDIVLDNDLCKIARLTFLTRVQWSYCILQKYMRFVSSRT